MFTVHKIIGIESGVRIAGQFMLAEKKSSYFISNKKEEIILDVIDNLVSYFKAVITLDRFHS